MRDVISTAPHRHRTPSFGNVLRLALIAGLIAAAFAVHARDAGASAPVGDPVCSEPALVTGVADGKPYALSAVTCEPATP